MSIKLTITGLSTACENSLEKTLSHCGLEESVTMSSSDRAADDIGAAQIVISNDFDSNKTDQLVFPLRIGTLLDKVKKVQKTGARGAQTYNIGSYTLNVVESTLMHRQEGRSIRLTDKETDILVFLHDHRGNIVERDVLLQEIWGYHKDVETHTIETHIYRLRQKIEDDPANPEIVLTHDKGYSLGGSI